MSKLRLACSILPQEDVLHMCYSRNICLGPTLFTWRWVGENIQRHKSIWKILFPGWRWYLHLCLDQLWYRLAFGSININIGLKVRLIQVFLSWTLSQVQKILNLAGLRSMSTQQRTITRFLRDLFLPSSLQFGFASSFLVIRPSSNHAPWMPSSGWFGPIRIDFPTLK